MRGNFGFSVSIFDERLVGGALVRDPYFRARMLAPASPPLVGGAGVLDAAGHATAMVVPALPHVALHGVTLNHALVVFDALGAPEFVSNAFPLELGF